MQQLVDAPVPVSDHVLDLAIVLKSEGAVVTVVDSIDNVLVEGKKGVAQQVEGLHALEGHLHDHLHP